MGILDILDALDIRNGLGILDVLDDLGFLGAIMHSSLCIYGGSPLKAIQTFFNTDFDGR